MARTLHTEQLRRPWAVWWAVLLAVLFAMAPTLSHGLAFASGDSGFEICTAQGAKRIAPDGAISGDSSNGQESTAALSHCPFCLHTADRLAPPPHHLAYLFVVMGGQQERTVWQAFFYADNTLFWAAPRGPPAPVRS
jgi:hypothetical protein